MYLAPGVPSISFNFGVSKNGKRGYAESPRMCIQCYFLTLLFVSKLKKKIINAVKKSSIKHEYDCVCILIFLLHDELFT